ncbi:hypothetical protein LTR56_002090 [Elasticomyces elasticus]|nr:hypothetical protein LTR22_012232 [Elasticomyces elasticus]KAK3658233.1 hypothetical protein LTR56_002090 [Elasticomyces elasticus]KAK4919512.1 hypothetical protein LTR49_012890 [Elasticomyces elasticus]KAK5764118.1 hypothetical protein LTS12_005812 [Elasticomyces elasticus]
MELEPHEEAEPFLGLQTHHVRRHTVRWYEDARTTLSGVQFPKGVTRKHSLVAGGSLLLIITFLLAASQHNITKEITPLNASGICSVSRLNPFDIKAPINPDIQRLTAFWPNLKEALVDNGKELPQLEQPAWMPDTPTDDLIRGRTSLISSENATIIREQHAGFLRDMPAYPEETFKGRGVVMLAGGRYSEYAVTALGVLRESGSKLPVEVWRRDEREEKHGWCDEMEKEGMACRRLSDYLDTDILAIADGKEMKVFTMLFSSFEEVFFIDADNMALQPPEKIFESKHYKKTGVVLWHDYWLYDSIDWLDYVVGLSGNRSQALWQQRTYESGQIAWNKRKQWEALLLTTYYNYYGPSLYYTLLNTGHAGWGDKDTFPLALRALEKPFHAVSHPPADAWVNGKVGERRTGMLQMSPTTATGNASMGNENATAAFLHATTVKWSHRAFLCDGCLPIWHTNRVSDAFRSDWEKVNGELHPYLHDNIRLIDPEYLQWMPAVSTASSKTLDAELRIWRAIEHAACRSPAWRHGRTCVVARKYMMNTFAFTFVMEDRPKRNTTEINGGEAWLPKMEENACLVNPP